MMMLPRVYHPYWDWEEMDHNMWGSVNDRKLFLRRAIQFTGNYRLYGRFMMRVVNEWPISCENALTDSFINRRAWLGHAACALAIGCPEDITREAWGYLSDEQQSLANKKAGKAIQWWENNYIQGRGLCKNMGGEVLSLWDSR